MVVDGPFCRLKDFVEVGIEVFSHFCQSADEAMRVCLRLTDQGSLANIVVATLLNVAHVGHSGVMFENVSAVHHHLKEGQIITNTPEHINIKHGSHGRDSLGLYVVKYESLKISLPPSLHWDASRDLDGHISAACIELGNGQSNGIDRAGLTFIELRPQSSE
jgi:hypothetical protein